MSLWAKKIFDSKSIACSQRRREYRRVRFTNSDIQFGLQSLWTRRVAEFREFEREAHPVQGTQSILSDLNTEFGYESCVWFIADQERIENLKRILKEPPERIAQNRWKNSIYA